MSIKGTSLPFNPNEKPEGMSEREWSVIDQMTNLQLKMTAIKAFHTRQKRKLDAAAAKPAEPPEKARLIGTGYIAKEFVLLNLPYSKPKGDVWARRNGNLSLIVQGGYKINKKTGKPENVGVPYGATARLVLFYIMSAAAFSETRKIYLGHSFDAFLKTIGASPERRGVKTGAKAVLNQLEKLIHSSIKIHNSTTHEDFEIHRTKALPLISDSEIWFRKKEKYKHQDSMWNSYIEISEELFQSLKKHPVPIDWDIVLKIRNNPTALDFYAFLTYESAKAQINNKGRFIPWKALQEQMGSGIDETKDFAKKGRAAIKTIKKHYPALKVSFPRGGLLIEGNSLPSVKPLQKLH